MNVSNNLQALQQLFSSPEVTETAAKTNAAVAQKADAGADQATLSTAASLAAAAAPDSDVRMEKVAEIQQALASGTYNVPAAAVAGKMIDQLLGR
ncbi:MAG: flagellar biosynthesis anti-sigma factor FlgM [Acidobacteriaceae bacterium]